MNAAAETDRVRRVQDKQAPRYDRQISLLERILFAGGREWVCSQASGKVLELACGTARNLPFYDHLLRDPLDYLPSVGFEIDLVERTKWGIVERLLAHKPS